MKMANCFSGGAQSLGQMFHAQGRQAILMVTLRLVASTNLRFAFGKLVWPTLAV
jgi:hypothetical protein